MESTVVSTLVTLPASESDPAPARPPLIGWIEGIQHWLMEVSASLPHAAGVVWSWWPQVVTVIGLYLVARLVVFGLRLRLWPRVITAGYWARVTPPRELDPVWAEPAWRGLFTLAQHAAGSRWRLVRPPLVFEFLGHPDGRVEVGVWLPAWVPFEWAAAELQQCWPGSRVTREAVPMPPRPERSAQGVALVGLRLSADEVQSRWLVDDPRPQARSSSRVDTGIEAMLRALGARGTTTWVQALVRPATRRDLRWLAVSSRWAQVPPRWQSPAVQAALRLWLLLVRVPLAVLDFFLSSSTTTRSSGPAGNRWAWPGHWLLLSATELAALVHLPADPARYGIDTASAYRSPPPRAARPGTGRAPNPAPTCRDRWDERDRQHPQPDPAPTRPPDPPRQAGSDEEGGDDEYLWE